jgi:ADP-ribose pyrophosphatase YjhB (NUDIX family)
MLLARMTYGPNKGRYMIPGGFLDPGETLDAAAVREVREETGVDARPLGIIGVRSRFDGDTSDNYVVWLMELVSDGEPVADGREIDHCCFLTFDEIESRDDVSPFVTYIARRVREGRFALHEYVADYTGRAPSTTENSWRLFM